MKTITQAEIVSKAVEVFGASRAQQWLNTPCRELDNLVPLTAMYAPCSKQSIINYLNERLHNGTRM